MKKNFLYGLLIGGCLLVSAIRMYSDYRFEPATYAGTDFPVFYVAAQFIQRGQPIYHNEALFDAVVATRGSKGAVRYLYPPTALLFFLPLTWFSYPTAQWLWFSLSIIILGGTVTLLLPTLLRRSLQLRDLAIITAIGCVFSPLFTVLRSGQVNIVLMGLLFIHVWLYLRGHTKCSALTLSAMIFLKVFPVVLILYYMLKRQWMMVLYTSLGLGVGLVLSVVLFGWQPHLAYLQQLPKRVTAGIHPQGLARHDNVTLYGFMNRITLLPGRSLEKFSQKMNTARFSLPQATRTTVKVIYYSTIIPLLLWLAYSTWRTPFVKQRLIVDVALWCSTVLVVAKDAHIQYLIILLPTVVFLALQPRRFWRTHRIILVALFVAILSIALAGDRLIGGVQLPTLLYVLPLGLIGNSILWMVFGTIKWVKPN